MAGGLGKGLRAGGELFKRTEAASRAESEAKAPEDTKTQMQEGAIEQNPKIADVRKHIVLTAELADRMRRFCFERRKKEVWIVREALDKFLASEGF